MDKPTLNEAHDRRIRGTYRRRTRARKSAASGVCPPHSVLDPDVLAEIRELGQETGLPLLTQMLTRFAATIPATGLILQDALERGDAGAVLWHAHRLRTSAGTLGARRLAGLCCELEGCARATQGEALIAAGVAVLDELQAVRREVQRLLETEAHQSRAIPQADRS